MNFTPSTVRHWVLIRQDTLLNWRQAQLSGFVFNPATSIPQSEIDALRSKFVARLNVLEVELLDYSKSLSAELSQIESGLVALQADLCNSARKYAQAKADEEAVCS